MRPRWAMMPRDDDEWERAIRFHEPLIYRLVGRRIKGRELKDDVVNMVRVKCWQKRHTFDPAKGYLTTWIGWEVRSAVLKQSREDMVEMRHNSERVGIEAAENVVGVENWDAESLNRQTLENAKEAALAMMKLKIPEPIIRNHLAPYFDENA